VENPALLFTALDKLGNQGVHQAIIVVPEKSIGPVLPMSPCRISAFGPIGL